MPTERGSGSGDRARGLYAEYLRKKRTTDLPFAEFRARYPDLGAELDQLHAAYTLAMELEAESDPPTTVSARLREQYGERIPVEVTLPGEEGGAPGNDFVGEIVGRVDGHGPYVLRGEIARGGQGAVLRVWDRDLNRNLAMKVVLDEGRDPAAAKPNPLDPHALGRFLEEAQVTGQLDHPGIVPVHELGVDDKGRVFFTMKLVKGRDLATVFDLVHEGKEGWNLARALGVMMKVCDAMSYAHAKGVIHRDLKPSNVMVGRFGEVYVMDWGVAKIVGREDSHDVRLQTAVVRSDWREKARAEEPKLLTMDGDIVGTPAYMSPEQASGELDLMGPHSDVYSVGAMLYHLLSGRMPYATPGEKAQGIAVWSRLREGPPAPLHEIAKDAPPELVAICEKAMARDWRERYADMSELAADLQAFLEHRVVPAYETGAWAEARKWVARNRGLAAACALALALALGGLGTVSYVEAKGRETAEAEREAARLERAKVLRLAAFQELQDLRNEAERLWPVRPERVPAYERWLARARALVASLDTAPGNGALGHLAQLAELRQRALPRTPEELERDRRAHPRFEEYDSLRRRVAALRAAERTRREGTLPPAPSVDPSLRFSSVDALNREAWRRVDPDRPTFGDERVGLELARMAVAKLDSDREGPEVLDTLAWALFANGLDEDALAAGERALAAAPAEDAEVYRASLERLRGAVADVGSDASKKELQELEARLAELEAEVSTRATWTFASDEDRWWHDQLCRLIEEIRAFADPRTGLIEGISASGWGVATRLRLARDLEATTLTGVEARRRWDEAVRDIADPVSSPAYRGLVVHPQLGLLPLGKDPDSGLWEFAHVLSGDVPERDDAGHLRIRETTAVVLVLLPGGTAWMGSQRSDPDAANYDPASEGDERPVHEVSLDPFFLSKYELTQGQWIRLSGSNPSTYHPGFSIAAQPEGFDLSHPVEMIDWRTARAVLSRVDLALPTEAQWEYGARGGTDTPWSCGADRHDLEGHANLADRTMRDRGGQPGWEYEDWADGYSLHAPVGSFLPNPFGLHDVHGNVWELCGDPWGEYGLPVSPGNGARLSDEEARVARGGSFEDAATVVRCASRSYFPPNEVSALVGTRPARPLQR